MQANFLVTEGSLESGGHTGEGGTKIRVEMFCLFVAVAVSQVQTSVKTHQILSFKQVQVIVHKSYLEMVIIVKMFKATSAREEKAEQTKNVKNTVFNSFLKYNWYRPQSGHINCTYI